MLEAFGVDRGALAHLEGGEGTSWRAGDLVLKPGLDQRFVAWLASLGEQLDTGDRFRLANPVAALDGRFVVGGWSATAWMAGEPRPGEVRPLLDVSADLHAALRATAIAWPAFLRARTDRWATADRVAWGEERPSRFSSPAMSDVFDELDRFLLKPWRGDAPQLVHADLTGNVLFDEGEELPPAVIDLSPYFRPALFADAVVVVDAVAWHDASLDEAVAFATASPFSRDALARAVVFRLVAAPDEIDRYRALVHVAAASVG